MNPLAPAADNQDFPEFDDFSGVPFPALWKEFPRAQFNPLWRTVDGLKAMPGLHLRSECPSLNWAVCALPASKSPGQVAYGLLDVRTGVGIVCDEDSARLLPRLVALYREFGVVEFHEILDEQPGLPSLN